MKTTTKHVRARAVLALLALAALLLTAAACGHETAQPAPPTGLALPPGTQVATASLSAAGGAYTAVGSVESRTTAAIAARVSGYVTHMKVHAGDHVRRGQVLAVLSTPESGDQVRQAQAALAAAQAQAQAAQQQVASAQAQAEFAASTYRRYQQLRRENSVSPHEFDEIASRQQAAQAGEAAARARQQAAQSQMQQARAALAQARTVSGFSTVTAPFDGVVTQKNIDAGALAMPGMTLLTLERPDQLQLAVSVPDSLLGSLRVGEKVEAQVDARPGQTMTARISEITPVSDPAARAALVKVTLPAAPGLRSGEYGHVTLPAAGAVQKGLTVPQSAVLHQGELDEMYVLNAAGRAELRLIATGAASGGQVEVLSGLNPGERYVVQAHALQTAAPGENHVR